MSRPIILLFAAVLAHAAVTRVEVTQRADVPQTNYEQITAKVYFAVDPKLAANKIIVDLDRAPRNDKGLVEFSADLVVMQPKDAAKSNGTALLEISNRGGKGMVGMFDLAGRGDAGDSLLLEAGYTLVWVGWEFDVPDRTGMKLYAPEIRGITGPVRSEIIVDRRATSASLADRAQIPYAVADQASATMTVRDGVNTARTTIPRDRWKFNADATGVRIRECRTSIPATHLTKWCTREKIRRWWELGPAAVRDYIAYMKQQGEVKRAIGFWNFAKRAIPRASSCMTASMPMSTAKSYSTACGRTSWSRKRRQLYRPLRAAVARWAHVDEFLLSHGRSVSRLLMSRETRTAESPDSMLARARKDGVVPKIFYTNGSCEYWGRNAGLIHISPDGKKDVPPPPTTRIYYLAGTQHGANAQPVRNNTDNRANPEDYRFAMRALLVQMNSWITDGSAPPESMMPRINKDQLVAPSALNFPKVPGVKLPTEPSYAWRMDFGPDFKSKGIVSIEPPKVAKPFPTLVPQVDRDGNETAGVRLPELAVPLATFTGWNLRDAKIGAPDEIQSMVGSFIPFARTKAGEGEDRRSTRPSIEDASYSGPVKII